MKHLLSFLLAFTISLAAQDAPPRLIVRADDMGYAHSGNEAILKTCTEGFATSIEILVPSPWFPEAIKMLEAHPNIDVGIHLALTAEWDNVKWRPLTDCPSLRDADGYFFPMLFPNKNYPNSALTENAWKIEDIEKEFRAQIELGLKKCPRISHVSGHMGCININPRIKAVVEKLALEYKIEVETGAQEVKRVGYAGPRKTPAENIDSFIKMLDTLQPGKTYLFIDHPGLDTPEVRAIHHIGYEDVATDRQGVTDLYTNPQVRAAIKTKGIQLVSYRDLSPPISKTR